MPLGTILYVLLNNASEKCKAYFHWLWDNNGQGHTKALFLRKTVNQASLCRLDPLLFCKVCMQASPVLFYICGKVAKLPKKHCNLCIQMWTLSLKIKRLWSSKFLIESVNLQAWQSCKMAAKKIEEKLVIIQLVPKNIHQNEWTTISSVYQLSRGWVLLSIMCCTALSRLT